MWSYPHERLIWHGYIYTLVFAIAALAEIVLGYCRHGVESCRGTGSVGADGDGHSFGGSL